MLPRVLLPRVLLPTVLLPTVLLPTVLPTVLLPTVLLPTVLLPTVLPHNPASLSVNPRTQHGEGKGCVPWLLHAACLTEFIFCSPEGC